MASSKRSSAIKLWDKYKRLGYGQGSGEKYRPYIMVKDASTYSCKYRIHSPRFNRTFHFLSAGEYLTFLQLDWNDKIVEIKEQFPLEPKESLSLCQEYGVKPPHYRNDDIVMTTDLVISIVREQNTQELLAFQVKHKQSDLTPRVQEKLFIEREYWKRRNVKWRLLLSSTFNHIFCNNLKVLQHYRNTLLPESIKDELCAGAEVLLQHPELSFEKCNQHFKFKSRLLGELSATNLLMYLTACKRVRYLGLKKNHIYNSSLADFALGV